MSAVSFWTEDRVQTLTRLWREGASAREIAHALAGCVTRNAVIGKVYRLGLSGRSVPARPRTVSASSCTSPRPKKPPVGQPRPRPARLAPPSRVSPDAPSEGKATVLTVSARACRWPYGDPLSDGFSLCGRPAVRGAYCAAHAEVAYRPTPDGDHLLDLASL